MNYDIYEDQKIDYLGNYKQELKDMGESNLKGLIQEIDKRLIMHSMNEEIHNNQDKEGEVFN